jgi:radical SAM superfamily enzyme YgiQ (UPF0313 family)
MNVALINTNRIKPPIAPVALDYLAEFLKAAGYEATLLDLCFADDTDKAIADFFKDTNYNLVGITLRNTDDCAYASRQSFLTEFKEITNKIREHTAALVVAGGTGFSIMPGHIMDHSDIDAGLWGEGEFIFAELAGLREKKKRWLDLPNLITRRFGRTFINPSKYYPLTKLPGMNRSFVDNRRYFKEGGQIGIETKRGCTGQCIYCADPIAKGNKIRLRPPRAVVDELESLLEMGIDHIHTCDSEFNMPDGHAIDVCKEIIGRKLGDRLKWYAYCSPAPFSDEMAKIMKTAGCAGINFGVDSGDDRMLKTLKRDFTSKDIQKAVKACKEAGITVMLDLLLGAPGETAQSITNTVELMKKAAPDRVGVALGVRVYPGTELAKTVKKGLKPGKEAADPLFFIEPSIDSTVSDLIEDLVGNDERFFLFNPKQPEKNYNYNANQRLVEAIGQGYRGAYWDILLRYK